MVLIGAKRFVLFLAVWAVLSGADAAGLLFGALAAAGAAWSSMLLLPPGEGRVDALAIVKLVPGFLRRSLAGGVDVARRALHPKMPLDEGWIVHRTTLPPGPARLMFGSETSLLPGSLVAGGRGDLVYVHCLDRSQDVSSQLREEEARIATVIRRAASARRQTR